MPLTGQCRATDIDAVDARLPLFTVRFARRHRLHCSLIALRPSKAKGFVGRFAHRCSALGTRIHRHALSRRPNWDRGKLN